MSSPYPDSKMRSTPRSRILQSKPRQILTPQNHLSTLYENYQGAIQQTGSIDIIRVIGQTYSHDGNYVCFYSFPQNQKGGFIN